MRVSVFTMKLDQATGSFDTGGLDAFHKGREVLEVGEHFFIHEQVPTLALVIRYRDADPARVPRPDSPPRKDWRAELEPQAQALYDELRTWRHRRSKHEGMPPFLILGNRELAAIAATRPDSQAGLRAIDGIGAAKVARWGQQILDVVTAFGDRPWPDPAPPNVPEPNDPGPNEPVPNELVPEVPDAPG